MLEATEVRGAFLIADEFLENLKFNGCIPTELSREVLRERLLSLNDLSATREHFANSSLTSYHVAECLRPLTTNP